MPREAEANEVSMPTPSARPAAAGPHLSPVIGYITAPNSMGNPAATGISASNLLRKNGPTCRTTNRASARWEY
eukprot:6897530-Pyramimonas_sp.AAC.1